MPGGPEHSSHASACPATYGEWVEQTPGERVPALGLSAALAAARAHRLADVGAYLLIGGLSVATDLLLLVVLVELVGVPVGPAAAASFATSVVVNFALNRLLAGGAAQGLLGRAVLRYGVLLAANLTLTVVVVTAAEGAGVPYLPVKVAVVVASTAWNYVLYRRWVFAADARR